MVTYFVFSDESGEYRANPDDAFCKRRPYYVRSAVILSAEDWALLKEKCFELKGGYGLPTDKEVKWSYLWSLTKHHNSQESIPTNKPYYFLKDYKLSTLYDFVSENCELLSGCSFCRIVLTVTPNEATNAWSKSSIYKWHLQEIMQRIEMEIQHKQDNLAIIFFDATDRDVDRLLREAYSSIYLQGDFIEKYSHIKDSISLELSHHSFGIQIADYASGSFNGFLRGYEFSTRLFHSHLHGSLRCKLGTNEILGFGIREVPRNKQFRSQLESKLISLLPFMD